VQRLEYQIECRPGVPIPFVFNPPSIFASQIQRDSDALDYRTQKAFINMFILLNHSSAIPGRRFDGWFQPRGGPERSGSLRNPQ
jgi:hypothetical protein